MLLLWLGRDDGGEARARGSDARAAYARAHRARRAATRARPRVSTSRPGRALSEYTTRTAGAGRPPTGDDAGATPAENRSSNVSTTRCVLCVP